MTEQTKVLSIRMKTEEKEELAKYLNRESAESLLKQIESGEIELTLKGVIFTGVDTKTESVNTTNCDGCPYIENALNLSKFDEVCEFKGLNRQQALDKCTQMLWR